MESQLEANGGKANVEISDDAVSLDMTTEDGASIQAGKGTKLPTSFPKDVPLYQPSTLLMVHSQPDKQTYILQACSDDKPSAIADSLSAAATKQGWQQKMTTTAQGGTVRSITYEKAGRMLQVAITADGKQSMINIATSPNP